MALNFTSATDIKGLNPNSANEIKGLNPTSANDIKGLNPTSANEIKGLNPTSANEIKGLNPTSANDIKGLNPTSANEIKGLNPTSANDIKGLNPTSANDIKGLNPTSANEIKALYAISGYNPSLVSISEQSQHITYLFNGPGELDRVCRIKIRCDQGYHQTSDLGLRPPLPSSLNLSGYTFQSLQQVKSKFQEVFNQAVTHLTLRETEYFGLAIKKDGEYQFVSNDEKIHKHVHKTWKSGPGDGFDGHGRPILELYFRVQYYVDQVVLLREKVTRHLYYLQLKDNVLSYHQGCQGERFFQIAAYALQADFGNYTAAADMHEYFDPREYFPAWILEAHGEDYIVNNTPVVHRDLRNLSRSEAEWRFIKETSSQPAAHNLHFYRLRKKKTDRVCNAWLGICAKGIEIYEKKKFEIRAVGSPAGRKFSYYTDSDVKSKYLLSFSRNTHMFQMAIQPKLMEIRHLDEEDKRRYRESYVSSDPRESNSTPGTYRVNKSPRSTKMVMGNRYSVVSDASSNTTSGIASDKMTVSFEENEGYKPSPVPGANRSPQLDHSHSQFNAYTFPTPHRVPVHSPPYPRLTNQNNTSTGSVQSDRSGSGQSEGMSLESGSSGSYRKRYKNQQSGVYSPGMTMLSDLQGDFGAREKVSQPSSRSVSQKDSFKDIIAEIRAHQNPSNMLQQYQSHLLDTPPLHHVPSFHMEDLDFVPRPLSLSGSSDQRGNKSFSSDLSAHSSQPASMSTVTSHDYENVVMLSHDSSTSFVIAGEETSLQEAEEVFVPPVSFADGKALRDIPAATHYLHSQTETDLAVTQLPENGEVHDPHDLQGFKYTT
ncbi:FRMD1-like protein [Mya arenaria]|uniref:FRMD1-like protein n=1 Tax=Mya arenaria TaxID=6604 RepID=A0ABY7FD58_MYAAR|nr:FRMD1-like protein [Mya arenaria]